MTEVGLKRSRAELKKECEFWKSEFLRSENERLKMFKTEHAPEIESPSVQRFCCRVGGTSQTFHDVLNTMRTDPIRFQRYLLKTLKCMQHPKKAHSFECTGCSYSDLQTKLFEFVLSEVEEETHCVDSSQASNLKAKIIRSELKDQKGLVILAPRTNEYKNLTEFVYHGTMEDHTLFWPKVAETLLLFMKQHENKKVWISFSANIVPFWCNIRFELHTKHYRCKSIL